ncbi:ADP-heptose--LPS heptosyltransferase II [Helicobacter acinonychis]|nr:ADP-heptose--LPS heptosyltransferase II [Helicobacter acinonychis]
MSVSAPKRMRILLRLPNWLGDGVDGKLAFLHP